MANYSFQRELIKKNLIQRYDHPTADMVYRSIRKELPTISLGTVYRNLKFLVENGDIISLKFADGKEHFDGQAQPHYHFVCSECGNIEDIYMAELQICGQAAENFDGEITGHSTYFYGLCNKCRTKH